MLYTLPMGRGQGKNDPFASVFGTRRGNLTLNALTSAVLTPEAERASDRLIQSAREGHFAEALGRICALSKEGLSIPALDRLYGPLGAELLPRGWQRRSEAWRTQFPTPLFPEPPEDTLAETLGEQGAAVLKDFAFRTEPPHDLGSPAWQKTVEDWRKKAGRKLLHEEHLDRASYHLSVHRANSHALLREILDLDPDAKELVVNDDLSIPLRPFPLKADKWKELLQALIPPGTTLGIARATEKVGARREAIRLLLAQENLPPRGPSTKEHPSVAVGNLVRGRMSALGKTAEQVEKESGCSPAKAKRGHYGGGRSTSLPSVVQFCRPLGLSAGAIYLCGLAAELPDAKRMQGGQLHTSRYAPARRALNDLALEGAPEGALQEIGLYIDGTLPVKPPDISYWIPFHQLLTWQREQFSQSP